MSLKESDLDRYMLVEKSSGDEVPIRMIIDNTACSINELMVLSNRLKDGEYCNLDILLAVVAIEELISYREYDA